MASNLTNQINVNIDCKCRRGVNDLLHSLDHVVHNCSSLFQNKDNGHAFAGNEIIQLYKTVLLSNILIDGQPLKGDESALDTTVEFEPFDKEKQDYVSNALLDQLDRQVFYTTRLRSIGAKQARWKIKKCVRPEVKKMSLLEVNTQITKEEEMDTTESESGSCVSLEEVASRLQASEEKCSYVKQNCEDMVIRCKDLSQALHIYKQSQNSKISKELFETPPSSPDLKDKQSLDRKGGISKKLQT